MLTQRGTHVPRNIRKRIRERVRWWHLPAILLVLSGLGFTLSADSTQAGKLTDTGASASGDVFPKNASSEDIPATTTLGWDNRFGTLGVDSQVNAVAITGTDVYVGGYFTTAGGASANYIARWNGSAWSTLGSGLNNRVYAIAITGTDVYVGGDFTTAGGSSANFIARWDTNTSSWSALGSGLDGNVYAIAITGTDVYVGGAFTTAGGVSGRNNIAKWNGSSWSALGTGVSGSNNYVRAIAVSGTDVYVGGAFTSAGGNSASYIAKWDGSNWSALGAGVDSTVWAIAISGTDVYVGGHFTVAGACNPCNRIAKWNTNTNTWSALGSGANNGVNSYVNAITIAGSDVYVGGGFTTYFTQAGEVSANYIARWDGSNWSALGSGLSGIVHIAWAIAITGTDVYVGGDFTIAGGSSAHKIARWNTTGSQWFALGTAGSTTNGMSALAAAIAISSTDVYVGGSFTIAGTCNPCNGIAKWDGSSWSALGSGPTNGVRKGAADGSVAAITISGTDVYVSGDFNTAGGLAANNIAKWDATTGIWSALVLLQKTCCAI